MQSGLKKKDLLGGRQKNAYISQIYDLFILRSHFQYSLQSFEYPVTLERKGYTWLGQVNHKNWRWLLINIMIASYKWKKSSYYITCMLLNFTGHSQWSISLICSNFIFVFIGRPAAPRSWVSVELSAWRLLRRRHRYQWLLSA